MTSTLIKNCISLLILFFLVKHNSIAQQNKQAQNHAKTLATLREKAQSFSEKGNFTQAIQLYQKLIVLEKSHPPSKSNYLNLSLLFDDYKTLAQLYQKNDQIDSVNITCQAALSVLEKVPTQSWRIKKSVLSKLESIQILYQNVGLSKEALAVYKRIVNEKFDQSDPLWYCELLEYSIRLKDYKQAQALLRNSHQVKFNLYKHTASLYLYQFGDTILAPKKLRLYPRQLKNRIHQIYDPTFTPAIEGGAALFIITNRNFDDIANLTRYAGDIYRLQSQTQKAYRFYQEYQSIYQKMAVFLEEKTPGLF